MRLDWKRLNVLRGSSRYYFDEEKPVDYLELADMDELYRTFEVPEENQIVINNYHQFLELMDKETPAYQKKIIALFPFDDYVLAFEFLEKLNTPFGTNRFRFICRYDFENTIMRDAFYAIARLKPNGPVKSYYTSFANYFQFICHPAILEVILEYNLLLSQNTEPYYEFKLKKVKKDGSVKIRDIAAPIPSIKQKLRNCNYLLQKVFDPTNAKFQVAYKKGKNIVDNAKLHKNHKYIYCLDLHDFFPSCRRELVRNTLYPVFERYYNSDKILEMFLDAILLKDALFIGSPVSGCIANKIISESASYMRNMAKKHDVAFSIYADDITFSSDRFISEKFATGMFIQGLTKYELTTYFKSNEKKSKGASKNRRRITGVSINNDDKLTVSRGYYRALRSSLNHLQYDTYDGNLQKLKGKIAYALMVDQSGKIVNLLKKYTSTIQQNKLVSDAKLKKLKVIK